MLACVCSYHILSTTVVNSRDQFLLARPFVPKGAKPPLEEGVVILWANQIKTIPELHTISNTLLGIKGFVGNLQGVGVRIAVSHVAPARALLQTPNPRVTNDDRTVGGFFKYLLVGVPAHMSSSQLIHALTHPTDDSGWQSWKVIPVRHQSNAGSSCSRTIKADEPPSQPRIFLPSGEKILISKLETAHEARVKKNARQTAKNEESKARRREQILQGNRSFESFDPWASWKPTQDSKGKGSKSSRPTSSGTSTTPDSAAARLTRDLQDLQAQVSQMNLRMDSQDKRMDNFQNTLAGNHSEIMSLL